MDKSWIKLNDVTSKDFVNGVKSFMRFALLHIGDRKVMRCPCSNCLNQILHPPDLVKLHILTNGMDIDYDEWVHHGEDPYEHVEDDIVNDDVDKTFEEEELLEDLNFGMHNFIDRENPLDNPDDLNGDQPNIMLDDEVENFQKLLKDTQRKLYPGCSKSLLSFLVKLLHIKVLNRMTNKCYDMIIDLFKQYLPEEDIIPSSFYEARKVLKGIGLGYEFIHACKNDCILFWKEHERLDSCPVCKESRWKVNDGKGKQVPHKILRYFPLKPRLRRLYMSRKTASDMRWHKDGKIEEDDMMIHPADSKVWKDFDEQYPSFAKDPRNVRLGLATDGFNPFGNMNNSYCIWPVVLMVYNLPPWQCMKEPYLMMSLLIPGPRSPGRDIDVYLRPLVDELNELWEFGVRTRDAKIGEFFLLRAAILWTINDFPAYGDISGHRTKGYYACPRCSIHTPSQRLRSKIGYIGHRRYLPRYHPYRKSLKFNGAAEQRSKPMEISNDDILFQLKEVENVVLGKHSIDKKRKRPSQPSCWTKKSILFELPYWSKLKLRHNLDVMHIEKNICDNVMGTILDIDGKTKDTEKARLDLEDMGIRSELHIRSLEGAKANKDGKVKCLKPRALFTLSLKEKKSFCEFLKGVKFPDGYAANISRCVNIKDGKITGLKSHDCHVLLQRLLPVGLRGYLHKDVLDVITELASFFRQLCSRKLNIAVLDDLENKIPVILSKLEMIFPPAFFDVMIHLAVHLAQEAKMGGPVHYRWMYPIERYLSSLKGMVRNRARPEGSIAEAYIVKECLTFCSLYLHGMETKYNRDERNYDGEAHLSATISVFRKIELYLREHEEKLKQENPIGWEARQKKEFAKWFDNRIEQLRSIKSIEATDELLALASGPDYRLSKYSGCVVEGVKYLTSKRDSRRVTQNNGVSTDSVHKAIKIDGDLTSVNVGKLWYENEPYILANQVSQVFYVSDTKLGGNWKVVQHVQHRHLFDPSLIQFTAGKEPDVSDAYQQENCAHIEVQIHAREIGSVVRNDEAPLEIEIAEQIINPRENIHNDKDEEVDEDEEDDTVVEYLTSDDEVASHANMDSDLE
ncbi:PREDICTED: uncharacterized protein LOC105949753 [Erythranthe guttata]|uniref:uncharacterized protein LOC105949753 n=1 Tax=Erythranthe guttata TaxID=4155 RepID=UPI00064DDEB1|nr:PREDICTED: uncharacterized protein LOC105949753 [Erythranthe guttata]|eukprot:XP_012828525.1 PREDICTED: uncharacterized protein LOC105949753 [Erythranthe guttata]